LTLQPLFKPYSGNCNNAERIWNQFLTLPSHVDLTKTEIDYVIGPCVNFQGNRQISNKGIEFFL
jgi:dTDP-4-amino-4,6-dideoxygalactose transaminase